MQEEPLDTLYPKPPKEIDLSSTEPKKTKVEPIKQVEERTEMNKFDVFMKSCQYFFVLVGMLTAANFVWETVDPDGTVNKNMKGLSPTERAYVKQLVGNCGSKNHFENKITECHVSDASLATLHKGEAVIAEIGPEPLPRSKPKNREDYEAEAEAKAGND